MAVIAQSNLADALRKGSLALSAPVYDGSCFGDAHSASDIEVSYKFLEIMVRRSEGDFRVKIR